MSIIFLVMPGIYWYIFNLTVMLLIQFLLWTYLLTFKLIWVLSFYCNHVDKKIIYAGFQTAYWPTYWQLSKTSVESLLIWRLTMFALLASQCLWTPVNPSQVLIRSSHSTLHLFSGFVSNILHTSLYFLAMFILYKVILA